MSGDSEFVLGISDDYVGNVALFHGDRPFYAAANERFTRKKGDAGFPAAALDAALSAAGASLSDIDRVIVANRTHFVYRLLRSRFEDYAHDFFSLKQKVYLRYHDLVCYSAPFTRAVHAFNAALLALQHHARVSLCDHHDAHAWAGVATSGFDDCLAVTIDNLGDGYSSKVQSYRDGQLTYMYGSDASQSLGQFYGEVTQVLGHNPLRHAGKVTGLSAHGDPAAAYPIMEQLVRLTEDRRDFRLLASARRWQHRGPYWKLSLFSAEDVAAAAQKRLEDMVLDYVEHALRSTGHRRLVLGGGVTANVKLNMLLSRLDGLEALHVHPAMSDEGLAWGAASSYLLPAGRIRPATLESAYLGPEYRDDEVDRALADIGSVRPAAMVPAVAGLLARGHMVARHAGRLEYGPRALGNRSILYRPDDPSVNHWLNRKLHRTEFMPFAPVSLWEDASDCYECADGVRDTARFMTIALPCRPAFARACPGVVHVDGTARPQLVRREDNPDYYGIIEEYKRLTGLPCLINTSFNMHEEPIVNTPEDAVRAFRTAELDFLAIGHRIAWNPQRPELRRELDEVLAAEAGNGRAPARSAPGGEGGR